nr:uncharacterized protein LOC110373349 [Helicoverpa armigera]
MFGMYGAVLLSFVFVIVSAGFDKKTCTSYEMTEIDCCLNEYPGKMIILTDDMAECFSKEKSPCEQELCRAKQLGLTGDDDKLDRSKVLEVMFKRITDDPSLLEEVKSKCINGDIKTYGSAESCEGERVNRCIVTQWLKRCTKWNDNSTCQQFKEFFVKEC